MAGDALKERGWYLSEEGIVQCTQNGKSDASSLIKVALDTDLREIGKGWLPEDVNRGRADYVEGPGVLQLQKIRNVSAPKDNEESQAAPRLMKLVLTDGHTNCTAVETEVIKDIGLNTAPGSKIKLRVTTDVEHGFLLLNNKNTQLLGGRVDKLAESWELKKVHAHFLKEKGSLQQQNVSAPPYYPWSC